jgi:hypothetical protein
VSKRGDRMLVLDEEHGAMGRRRGRSSIVWPLAGGRECEVMGGVSV